jgi:hypothetical protein
MKYALTILFGCFLLVACQPTADSGESTTEEDSVKEIFKRNSQTVLNYLEDWQNESVDYATYFSEDYQAWGTGFNETDTTRYADLPESDQGAWDRYDFELITDPLNLLPGVNVETKEMDGSVRYYGDWKVTSPASDSSDEKSGILRLYQAYVFNEEGKINLVLTYGDFTGVNSYLNSSE